MANITKVKIYYRVYKLVIEGIALASELICIANITKIKICYRVCKLVIEGN